MVTYLGKIFWFESKELRAESWDKEKLLIFGPSEIISYQRVDFYLFQGLFCFGQIPNEDLACFSTCAKKFTSFIEPSAIDFASVRSDFHSWRWFFGIPNENWLIRTAWDEKTSILGIIQRPNSLSTVIKYCTYGQQESWFLWK